MMEREQGGLAAGVTVKPLLATDTAMDKRQRAAIAIPCVSAMVTVARMALLAHSVVTVISEPHDDLSVGSVPHSGIGRTRERLHPIF